jgi:hypothetical protein
MASRITAFSVNANGKHYRRYIIPAISLARNRGTLGSTKGGIGTILPRDDRKDDTRGILGLVIHGIYRLFHPGAQTKRFARIRINVESRVVAAGDICPDSVPQSEEVASGIGNQFEAIHSTLLKEFGLIPGAMESRPEYGVRNIQGVAVGVV